MKRIVMVAIVCVLALCGLGIVTQAFSDDEPIRLEPSPAASRIAAPPASKASAAPVSAAPAAVKIEGNNIVHVGEDVPAGTYRAKVAVEQGQVCYWSKSSDPEGENIIDNDIPSGGRPQVTLKKGQWFKTSDCPDWIKQ